MVARLTALVLCDFAQIRDGLLFVQSGGLTRLASTAFPARFGCHLATLVWIPPDQVNDAHEMVIKIKSASAATVVATVQVSFHAGAAPGGLDPGEGRLVPVAVPLASVAFPAADQYDLHVAVDDEFAGDLSFRVVESGAAPAH